MVEVGRTKAELDTPCLWVDMECLERNIAAMAQEMRRGGVQWRPHTKGIKVPAIAHKLLQAGAIGITCAKLGEAEVMAAAGIKDILIANQIVGDQKIGRLVNLRMQTDVKVAVDNFDNVTKIGEAACAKGTDIGVVVEVNTGMNRAGVAPGEETYKLARHVADTDGVSFKGLMSWEGHNVQLADPEEKRRGVEASVGQLLDSVQLCERNGLPVEIVSAGGSGTYTITSHIAGVTEIEAGGGIFCDLTYQGWGVELEPALFVFSTVTSRPSLDRMICDAGFKTLPRGYRSPEPVGIPAEGMTLSAEHGIVQLTEPGPSPCVGETIDLMVGYGDSTVFLHDTLYAVRNGIVEAAWDIQGRGKIR